MPDNLRLDPVGGFGLLMDRMDEPAPGRIQLIAGPRQVGKTHLLLRLAESLGPRATYAACDGPEAMIPGWWEQLWSAVEQRAATAPQVLLLDEVHLLPEWSSRLKSQWDRVRRRKLPIQVIATGSSALHLGRGSRETLAGRFERLVFPHWNAQSLANVFQMSLADAVEMIVQWGGYPGLVKSGMDAVRKATYLRDAIIEPAIGRDLLSAHDIRRPGLLRQVFAAAVASPAQVVSLQKLKGQLHDAGALETIAHYLTLLEDAFLLAGLEKYSTRMLRQRAAPPKLVILSNALLAAQGGSGAGNTVTDPALFGARVENACLAHAWNAGQRVRYWREEPLEVDAVLDGSWGSWAIEVKTGHVGLGDLRGLLEFVRRHPSFQPLLICGEASREVGLRAGIRAMTWQDFLADQWREPQRN